MAGLSVVVAVDGSKCANHAFQFYLNHFHRPEHHVTALYTTPPLLSTFYATPHGIISPEILNAFQQERDVQVSKVRKSSEEIAKGITHFKFVHLSDIERPGVGIVNYVKDTKTDFVVIGTRGMGLVKRTILGSVSDHVLHHVHVPVTVVSKEE